jgi:hypothetical protein
MALRVRCTLRRATGPQDVCGAALTMIPDLFLESCVYLFTHTAGSSMRLLSLFDPQRYSSLAVMVYDPASLSS